MLDRYVWLDRLEGVLEALPQSTRRRIALEQLRRCRDLTVEVRSLEREIRTRMRELAPDLMAIPGGGVTRSGSVAFIGLTTSCHVLRRRNRGVVVVT